MPAGHISSLAAAMEPGIDTEIDVPLPVVLGDEPLQPGTVLRRVKPTKFEASFLWPTFGI
ncbi:hypothetical protein [Microcystis phage Mwe-Yong1]|nr:hypothetical protein [Microcystis phage Mwe-Yong1]